MSELPSSEQRAPGPAPLPTWHGKGCICHTYRRQDCPAAQTPEGKQRDAKRALNAAHVRLMDAEENLRRAAREKAEAQAALDALENGQ